MTEKLKSEAPDRAAQIRDLAEQIAQNLFVNGSGQHADRLVLIVDGPPKRDLGGWSRAAMADQIEEFLKGLRP